jgi:hypothetical protein
MTDEFDIAELQYIEQKTDELCSWLFHTHSKREAIYIILKEVYREAINKPKQPKGEKND